MHKYIGMEVSEDGKASPLVNQTLKDELGLLTPDQVEAVQAFLSYRQLQLHEQMVKAAEQDLTNPLELAILKSVGIELKRTAAKFKEMCEESRKIRAMEELS